jgi:GAF domain-containing protein
MKNKDHNLKDKSFNKSFGQLMTEEQRKNTKSVTTTTNKFLIKVEETKKDNDSTSSNILTETPYMMIEKLKIKLEKKSKRIRELEEEVWTLKEINSTLLKSLALKDDFLLNIMKENKNIGKKYNSLLMEKESTKHSNLSEGKSVNRNMKYKNLKLTQPLKLSNFKVSSFNEFKLPINKEKEEGLEEFMKNNCISPININGNITQTSNFLQRLPSAGPKKFSMPEEQFKLINFKNQERIPSNSRLYPSKNMVITEANVNHYNSRSNLSNLKEDLNLNNISSSLFKGNSLDFYNRLERMNARQGHNNKLGKYRPSFLSMKEDFITKLIRSDSIKEIFKITNTGEDFILALKGFQEEKIKVLGENINNTLRDYVTALRVIIRIRQFLNISIKVTNALGLEEATGMLIRNTCEILDCDRATIFVFDKYSNVLNLHQGEGLSHINIKVPIDAGIAGWVFQKGERQRIDDAYLDSRFNTEVDLKTGYKTKTLLCAPLKSTSGEIIGVIQGINKKNGLFNSDDEEIMEIFATQASLILNNSVFFDENSSFVYRLRILIEFSVTLQKIDTLFDFTNESEKILTNLWTLNTSRFIIVSVEGKLIKAEKYRNYEYQSHLGLIGQVYLKKEFIAIENSNENPFYNALVDIESCNAILTFPIIDSNNNVVGVAQTSYANKLVKNTKKPRDSDMVLLEYFSKMTACWLEKYFKNS